MLRVRTSLSRSLYQVFQPVSTTLGEPRTNPHLQLRTATQVSSVIYIRVLVDDSWYFRGGRKRYGHDSIAEGFRHDSKILILLIRCCPRDTTQGLYVLIQENTQNAPLAI